MICHRLINDSPKGFNWLEPYDYVPQMLEMVERLIVKVSVNFYDKNWIGEVYYSRQTRVQQTDHKEPCPRHIQNHPRTLHLFFLTPLPLTLLPCLRLKFKIVFWLQLNCRLSVALQTLLFLIPPNILVLSFSSEFPL